MSRALESACAFLGAHMGTWVFENSGEGWIDMVEADLGAKHANLDDVTRRAPDLAQLVMETAKANGWVPPAAATDERVEVIAVALELTADGCRAPGVDWEQGRNTLRQAILAFCEIEPMKPAEALRAINQAEVDFLIAAGWTYVAPVENDDVLFRVGGWIEPTDRPRYGRKLEQSHAVNSEKQHARLRAERAPW